jgi:hypothetical protein
MKIVRAVLLPSLLVTLNLIGTPLNAQDASPEWLFYERSATPSYADALQCYVWAYQYGYCVIASVTFAGDTQFRTSASNAVARNRPLSRGGNTEWITFGYDEGAIQAIADRSLILGANWRAVLRNKLENAAIRRGRYLNVSAESAKQICQATLAAVERDRQRHRSNTTGVNDTRTGW